MLLFLFEAVRFGKAQSDGVHERVRLQGVKQLADITITPNLSQALEELRRRLQAQFDIEAVILYGSAARGEADEESDQDVLILTAQPLTRPLRHKITDIVFEINLHCGTNISSLVVDRNSWETGLVSVLPIHDEILKDGIKL
jgi:predicted nucleotidyltransferase